MTTPVPAPLTHCLSIDVEGFSEGLAEAIAVPPGRVGSAEEREEVARNVDTILAWLDAQRVRATFFTLGRIAETQPEVVRRIVSGGHELASHSYRHRRLSRLSRWAAREEIIRSKQVLEDASGRAVHGFRAPDFSIDARSLFLLDVIADAGYRYDSSICPVTFHDVYGVRGAGRDLRRLENGLVEFPPATVSVCGIVVPVLGGGYFRLAPLPLSRAVLRARDRRAVPTMTYTHPYELGGVYPRFGHLSRLRRFRHYVNIDRSRERFTKLVTRVRFGPAAEILDAHGWSAARPAMPSPHLRVPAPEFA